MSDRRVNARLSAEVARKVSYLERRCGLTTTQVILESIEHYYRAVAEEPPSALEALAGFVGCAEGPADLSSTYKSELSRSLADKA